MNITVFNKTFEAITIIDNYVSVIWNTKYSTVGEFELYVPMNKQVLDLLQQDYYLCRAQDISTVGNKTIYKNMMIIDKIAVTTDVEGGNYFTVTGHSLQSIIHRRIVWNQVNLSGTLEPIIRRLITENIVNPTLSNRKIKNFMIGDMYKSSISVEIQRTGDNVGEVIEELCTLYGLGYAVNLEISGNEKNFVFRLYNGENRSISQDKNPIVIFSPEFENLLNTDYSRDKSEYRNVALVAGEGEGAQRKTKICGTTSGLERYEMYVDARDLSTNDGDFTTSEYDQKLKSRGDAELAKQQIVTKFEGSTETRNTYALGEDYFLGDIVTVKNEYGITANPRVLEIIESEDRNGITIIPTFSSLEVE